MSDLITVCSVCKMASCWQGIFLCDDAVSAGTIKMSKEQLAPLALEHPSYWVTDAEFLAEADRMASSANNDIVARVNPSAFKDLKAEVGAILKNIKLFPPPDRYCVNYADLRCVGVSRVIEEDGGLWWLVEMEEGDDHEFCQLVRSKLSERWGSVIVRMEW